jgi:hypothetical protein
MNSFDNFSMSFIDADGNLNRVRSLSTPEDFIDEALQNEDKAKRYEQMANNKEKKAGSDDKDVVELRWAAKMMREHAASNREMAEIIRRQNNRNR